MSFSAAKAACVPALQRCWCFLAAAVGNKTGAGFFLLLHFFLSSPVRAEIFLEPRVGFHGVFQLGRPFPIEVEISNNGLPAEGQLEVRAWKGGATKGGAPYPVYYQREIFVAAQGRKTVQLTVDPDFISRPLSIAFSSAAGSAKREIDLRRYFTPAPVVLLVSESSLIPSVALGASSANRVIALSLAELPADARALLGVSHLILYDASLRELSRAQLSALDTWLWAGGRMVILGSLNYALYQESSLARFMPVRVTGTKRISYSYPAGKNQAPVSLSDVWAQTSMLVQGRVVAEAQGLPLQVESSRGKGSVTYFALDVGRPPLAQSPLLPRLLQSLLIPAPAEDALPRTQWDDSVFTQLILNPAFISSYVPIGALLIALAVYFVGLGFFTWVWQRKTLRGRKAVASLTAWVMLSSLGGYWYFSRGGKIPEGVLLVSSVIENYADGFVESQSNLALFSTQSRDYDLRPEPGWIDLTPVTARSREPTERVIVTQEGSGSSHYHFPLREWDYRLFRMRAVARLGLRAQFATEADKLMLSVDNQSGKDLYDCWLLAPGQRYNLGEIRRGASWRKTFSVAPPPRQENSASVAPDGVSFREVSFADKTRTILFHSSFFPRDNEARWNSGAAVFFGWISDPEPRVRIDDPQIKVQDYALFRAIIPLTKADEE